MRSRVKVVSRPKINRRIAKRRGKPSSQAEIEPGALDRE